MASTPDLPTTKVSLSPPSLSSLADALSTGLRANFVSVSVSVDSPPDLRQSPWHLSSAGLSGNPRISDVGGTANLSPTPDLTKKYDLLTIAKLMEMSPECGSLIGASAGPFHLLGRNTELMANISYQALPSGELEIMNHTHYAKVTPSGTAHCERVDDGNQSFGLMGNFLGTDGHAGPLLHVKASSRSGALNFEAATQASLARAYGDKLVSLGGVFLIHTGRANLHVMPDFSPTPLNSRAEVEAWMNYYDVDAPLVCLCVLHSGDDRGLGLRRAHTHCFSEGEKTKGGHYHFDLDESKDEVEYEAWFNVAEVLYRIDPDRK